MTDGIGRIFGGGGYGVGGYIPQRRNEENTNENIRLQNNDVQSEKQVNPDEVMKFLEQNNYFLAPAKNNEAVKVDEATENRIVDSMARFEEIYAVVEQEFGAEVAPTVMDLIMDSLMDKFAA